MRASDLMTTEVLTLAADATVADAVTLLTEHDVRHIPLVDEDEALVAVLSDRELRRVDGLLAMDIDDPEGARRVLDGRVIALTGEAPTTIAPDTHVDAIIDLFDAERLGAVVVVDDARRVLGIVSVLDVLRAARGKLG